MSGLRIGINALFMTPYRGGMATWVLEHVAALRRVAPQVEIVLYATRETGAHLRANFEWAGAVELISLPAWNRLQRPSRITGELALVPARLHHDRVDLLHSVANLGPIICPTAHVVTIHDLAFRRYPALNPGPSRHLVELVISRAASSATLITAPSQYTADDITRLLGVPADRIHVVPMGPGQPALGATDDAAIRSALGLGDKTVVLSVGAGFAHKNVGRLVEAFARVGPQRNAVLVHVGGAIFEGAGWMQLARDLGIEESVRWPSEDHYLSDAEFDALFSAASLYVHPALLEGFGMLPLEAMAHGVPVACSNGGSLPEVAGDAAAYFHPLDVEEMAAVIAELLDDPARREDLAALGREQVKKFSWEHTAREYVRLYETAYREHAG